MPKGSRSSPSSSACASVPRCDISANATSDSASRSSAPWPVWRRLSTTDTTAIAA
ncbi:Uncharacterised protein [Bordetella pertussis]|nr:Uncharacterised protein [Bordetella pertussis]CFP58939.1 Uncharacterised protein [Bordetella pertussis]